MSKNKNKSSKSKQHSKVNHNTSRGENLAYALSEKDNIYKWITKDLLTIGEVANRLGVSRSWLFKAFAECAELNEIKEDAFAYRRDMVEGNLYKRAMGKYTTTITRRRTSYTEGRAADASGGTKTVKSTPVTEVIEETITHTGDYDLKAIAMVLKLGAATVEPPCELDDTITQDDAYDFVDVSDMPDV